MAKNRPQLVVIDGEKSDEAQVHPGTPQGTILDRLFLLYINNIGNDLTSKYTCLWMTALFWCHEK